MAPNYLWSCLAMLSILMCFITKISPVQGSAIKALTCTNYSCEAGTVCYMKKSSCRIYFCPSSPVCIPICNANNCHSGNYCKNGKCVQCDCGPGKECIFVKKECITAPCDEILTCKTIEKCDPICPPGYKCKNGVCTLKQICGEFKCEGVECPKFKECDKFD